MNVLAADVLVVETGRIGAGRAKHQSFRGCCCSLYEIQCVFRMYSALCIAPV